MAGLENNLRQLRRAVGLTQEALARQAGISRQAYAALESGSANPSTEVSLRLARALERPVEGLFQLRPDPPRAVEAELAGSADGQFPFSAEPRRARLFRVGSRLFARELRGPDNARRSLSAAEGMIMAGGGEGAPVTVQPFDPSDLETPSLAVLGCDPAMALLEPELAARGVRLVSTEASSLGALEGLVRGEAHVAGCHLFDDATGTFNSAWVRRTVPFPCTLVTFASWQQGLMVAPGNPRGIVGIGSLDRPGLVIANRPAGSGSRALLDRGLRRAGIPSSLVSGYDRYEDGHLAVAAAVASGRADTGIGVKAAALALGLDFIPLEDERYDLVIPGHLLSEPVVQTLLDALRRLPLRRRVESLGGYDVSLMGTPASTR